MNVWSLAMASDWSIGSNWSPHWSRMTRALLPTPALRGARWLAARGTTGRTAWGPGLIRSTVKAPLEATMQVSEWVIPGKNVFSCFRLFPEGSWRFLKVLMVPQSSWRFLKGPEGSWRFLTVHEDSWWSLRVPEGPWGPLQITVVKSRCQ